MSRKITIELSERFAEDADEFGLLDEAIITSLLRAALDEAVNELVNEEIHRYRAEKRMHQDQSST